MPWGKNERDIVILTNILEKDKINSQEEIEAMGIISGIKSRKSQENYGKILENKIKGNLDVC